MIRRSDRRGTASIRVSALGPSIEKAAAGVDRVLWVGVGGLLGSIGRYLLGAALNRLRDGAASP
jgi:hypothetical protein